MTNQQIVLVVEDEPIVRMGIVDSLEDEGYKVLEAGDAAEALRILESDADIRLIFTDIDMPGSMDGLQLAAIVSRRWPPIRIIITSGQRLVEITDIPSGSMFHAKPYSYQLINSAVARLLR